MLVRKETSPEDVAGMHLATGILTATGGKASHAAVVARGWGKPCVVGCDAIADRREDQDQITIAGNDRSRPATILTIDGTTGDVMIGKVPTVDPTISGDFATLMGWADKAPHARRSAPTPTPPRTPPRPASSAPRGSASAAPSTCSSARQRIVAMRKMILADDEAGRKAALDELEPFQREDFIGIFEAMDGLPVTIRLLDPPLHEFLPHDEKGQAEVAKQLGVDVEEGQAAGRAAPRVQPDARASAAAACRSSTPRSATCRSGRSSRRPSPSRRQGKKVLPEIMIPLVGTVEELAFLKKRAIAVAEEVIEEGRRRRSST